MNRFDKMIIEGRFKDFEKLVLVRKASLEDLSVETYTVFKLWIELPKPSLSLKVDSNKDSLKKRY